MTKNDSIKVMSFDVDFLKYPQSKRASKIDQVSIACLGGLNCINISHSAFLINVCSLGQKEPIYSISRYLLNK